MAKTKGNMFDTAAQQRQQEQAHITAAVTGKELREGKGMNAGKQSKITLSMSEADKLRVKSYALRHNTTVSDLVHLWIQEHCAE